MNSATLLVPIESGMPNVILVIPTGAGANATAQRRNLLLSDGEVRRA